VKYFVGRGKITSVGEAEFAAQAILERSSEAQSRSMRSLARGDCAAMKVMPSCEKARANWGGLALAREFFFERPVGIAPD
jgi:hypothetical protein